MTKLARSLLAVLLVGLFGATSARATTPGTSEAYPPNEVFLAVIQPKCNPTSVGGTVRGALPGSTVTVTLTGPAAGWRATPPVSTVTITVDAEGNGSFTLPVPAGSIGTYTVTATGLRSDQTEFTLTQPVSFEECPPLPQTGSDATGTIVKLAALAAVGGLGLVLLASRRRRLAA